MSEFMAMRVMEAYNEGGLQAGQDKYRAYFVKLKLYLKYKPAADTILISESTEEKRYKDCIVSA